MEDGDKVSSVVEPRQIFFKKHPNVQQYFVFVTLRVTQVHLFTPKTLTFHKTRLNTKQEVLSVTTHTKLTNYRKVKPHVK